MDDRTSNEHETLSRRGLLAAAGHGLILSSLSGEGWAAETDAAVPAAGQTGAQAPTLPAPIKLPPLQAATERESGAPPVALPPEQRVGFALVGLGHLTLEQILPAFAQSKRCRPVALVSGDRGKAEQVARQYGIDLRNIYDYRSYDSIRDNPAIQVVYVVLPNSMHAEYTIRGAQAGKHILCEKPMATSVRECEQMIDACRKADRKLMIAYRIQYEPHNREVMQMVRSREAQALGTVKMLDMYNGQNQDNPQQWRLRKALSGGGALPDIGIYCLNTARFLTGEEPIEITAQIYTTPGDLRFREVEEAVVWSMRFPGGIQANCSTSYATHDTKRYRVQGSDAWADMDPAFSYNGLRLRIGRKSAQNPRAESVQELVMGEKNQFALEMDHMAECVQQNRQPYTPGEEGLQDHRLMAAIYEAARSGKTLKLRSTSGLDITRGPAPAAS